MVDFIGSFLTALVLFHTMLWADANTVTYERKPFKLYLPNNGYPGLNVIDGCDVGSVEPRAA